MQPRGWVSGLQGKAAKNRRGWLIAGALTIVVLWITARYSEKPPPTPSDTVNVDAWAGKEQDAFLMSQRFVKDRLKAPASANFCDWPEPAAQYDAKTHTYSVTCWVDSQNSFGAMLRLNYVAKLGQDDPAGGNWRLIGLKTGQR
jgi:hypothetical protein